MKCISNDSPSAFQTFMVGYWHQMSDEIYDSFSEALSDFRATEGDRSYLRLIAEIRALNADNRFPHLADIRSAYSDPFWKNYDRIVVQEDVDLSGVTSRDVGNGS